MLAACSSWQSATLATARNIYQGDALVDSHPLNPSYAYLRVTMSGVPAILVLGYVDQDASGQPVQVWYSADGKTLRLRGGRLAGVVGMPVEWRAVRWPSEPPRWEDAPQPVSQASYSRELDQMPGYHLGVRSALQLKPIAAPSSTAWKGPVPAGLHWYEEAPLEGKGFVARYAVQQVGAVAVPIYGEQCLTPEFCLTWQTWPPAQPPL